jgi:hypothetical protein
MFIVIGTESREISDGIRKGEKSRIKSRDTNRR